jgi:hypothetical protein
MTTGPRAETGVDTDYDVARLAPLDCARLINSIVVRDTHRVGDGS